MMQEENYDRFEHGNRLTHGLWSWHWEHSSILQFKSTKAELSSRRSPIKTSRLFTHDTASTGE
ncbi:MAG: hypothetical protein DME79_00770 [Verrucomicrobia bacterium]|nr:MAG: hypothetical protein DMC60_06520 [Verrucomicrobiota bacterium]PYJ36075.1 MAG: hypothetical protein DME79_00770 [Verrucomicrobiota bacterium]PYJ42668.1 MAG: hypothetical protein DME80_10960 [Verrucomicrobiota bacterium]